MPLAAGKTIGAFAPEIPVAAVRFCPSAPVIKRSLVETAGFFFVPIPSVDIGLTIAYYML